MELIALILGAIALVAIGVHLLTRRAFSDGTWHDHDVFWMVTTIEGERVFGVGLQRRLRPDGTWQYRKKSPGDLERDRLEQQW